MFKEKMYFFPKSFTYPSSDILVRAKRVLLFDYVSLLRVSLLCVGTVIKRFFTKLQFLISAKDFIIPILVIGVTQLVLTLPPILNRKLPESYKEASKLNEESSFCCTY